MPNPEQLLPFVKNALYTGVILFSISIIGLMLGVISSLVLIILHIGISLVALIYLIWYFQVTEGHIDLYDRVSEGTILILIIYNPFKPFILTTGVWVFLDFVFLWIFFLYVAKINTIAEYIEEGRTHWGNTGE